MIGLIHYKILSLGLRALFEPDDTGVIETDNAGSEEEKCVNEQDRLVDCDKCPSCKGKQFFAR